MLNLDANYFDSIGTNSDGKSVQSAQGATGYLNNDSSGNNARQVESTICSNLHVVHNVWSLNIIFFDVT